MLRLTLKPGDSIELDGGRISIKFEEKSGNLGRFAVDAPRDVDVKTVRAYVGGIAAEGLTRAK